MEAIVNLIMTNGIGIVLVGYFIYKDNRFNEAILTTLTEMKEVLAGLRELHRGNDNDVHG